MVRHRVNFVSEVGAGVVYLAMLDWLRGYLSVASYRLQDEANGSCKETPGALHLNSAVTRIMSYYVAI
jgi:hypothetical protein